MGRVPENPTRTRKNTKIPNFIYLKTRPKPGKKMWKPNTNLKKISEPNIWQPDQSLLISEEIKIEVKNIPVGISEKGWVIACSPSWYLTWLFLSFPTFGYLIKYLTELKKPSQYTIYHCRQSPNLFRKFQQVWGVFLHYASHNIFLNYQIKGMNPLCRFWMDTNAKIHTYCSLLR